MWGFALPLFLEMDTILHIWLNNPPSEAILFTRLALVEVLINSISLPIGTAARAPGKMKIYELTLGSIQIVIFIVSWIVLMMGGLAYSVFVVAIVANLVMFIVRLLIIKKLIALPLKLFFNQVIFPISTVMLFSSIFSFIIHFLLPKELVFTCISVLLCVIISCVCMYFTGMKKWERRKIRSVIINRINQYFGCF
jgi:hypothetical protein